MPLYDYRCETCGQPFEARHGFNDPAPPCPHCGSGAVHKAIRQAPLVAQGMSASLSKNASKAEIQAKWAEETPKLREKLVSKLGEEVVNKNASTLNKKYE